MHLIATCHSLDFVNPLVHVVLRSVRVVGWNIGSKTSEDDEENSHHDCEDDELRQGRVGGTVLVPRTVALAKVFLQLVATKLVIDETRESDAVAAHLRQAHRVTEDEHRCHDKHDVLQHTRQSEDERRGLANLQPKVRIYAFQD